MNKLLIRFALAIFIISFLAGNGRSQFYTVKTKNFDLIYYGKAEEYLVPYTLRCLKNALRFHRSKFQYNPDQRITVFLQDFWDYGNAGATAVPIDRIRMGIAPLSYVFETSPANERINHTMNHELVHVAVMDNPGKGDRFFRSVFLGKVAPTSENPLSMFYSYLTNPRVFSPRWYHEGIAVFFETWMAGGIGRAMGPYDEMVFRTKVRDNARIYDVVGLESEGRTSDFQVGVNSYLYGTRFVSYLADTYGPQKMLSWFIRSKGSKRYFSSQFKKTFGKSLDEAWEDWIAWEKQFQNENLRRIRQNPTTSFRPITRQALGSVSRAYLDVENGKIYAALNYPGQIPHLAAIDLKTGAIQKIAEVKGAALFYVSSIAMDLKRRKIFYTTDNNRWRDLNIVDLKTGVSRRLIKDLRAGDLAFNAADSSLWGVRHYDGISTITKIPYPYTDWKQVYSLPFGKDIYDLDISPDGKTLVGAQAEISGRQYLIKMDIPKLLAGDTTYQFLFDFENSSPANFVFSRDGQYIYGSSYYSGVSNIYRYDLKKNDMDILSNAETGFFRPLLLSANSLIVFRYTGKGFIPGLIAQKVPERVSAIHFLGNDLITKYPELKEWKLPPPSAIALDSSETRSQRFQPAGNIRLQSAYPVVEGYKDFAAMGMRLNFSDPLGISSLDFTASYSPAPELPDNERVHLNFSFRYSQWELFASHNGGDFYDLFGPTKSSRKGQAFGVVYRKSLLLDQPKSMDLSARVTGYTNLEKLPDYQNVSATFDQMVSFNLNLKYSNRRASLGAVDYEKGILWQIHFGNNLVNRKNFPRFFLTWDV